MHRGQVEYWRNEVGARTSQELPRPDRPGNGRVADISDQSKQRNRAHVAGHMFSRTSEPKREQPSARSYHKVMKASSTFTVKGFTPTDVVPSPPVTTGPPVLVATMEREFEGEIIGHSATLFNAAFDQATGVGTYMAMESFEGSLHGREGAFKFVHSAATSGNDRNNEFFLIVPCSGTRELAGITGIGRISIDSDATHRLWIEYELG